MYKELVHPKVIPDVLCLHSMTLIIRLKGLRLSVHIARVGEKKNVFSYLVGNPKLRRENNVKLDLIVILFEGANWIDFFQDRDM
jgi:hypothetical protein